MWRTFQGLLWIIEGMMMIITVQAFYAPVFMIKLMLGVTYLVRGCAPHSEILQGLGVVWWMCMLLVDFIFSIDFPIMATAVMGTAPIYARNLFTFWMIQLIANVPSYYALALYFSSELSL